MNLGFIGWIAMVAVPLGLGAALLAALGIGPRDGRVLFVARSWCVGALALAAILFGTASIGLSPRLVDLTPALLLVGSGLALVGYLRARWRDSEGPLHDAPAPRVKVHPLVWVALGLCCALALDQMLLVLPYPIVSGDEAHLWASRARVHFESGGFGPTYAAEFDRRILVKSGAVPFFVQHADYPHLGPLLQVWVYALADTVTWAENRVPLQLFGVATIALVVGTLALRVRWPIAAGAGLLLLASRPMQEGLSTAYVDLAVGAGFLLAVEAWLRLRASGETRWFALMALGLALALFAKHEGALLAVAFAGGVLVDCLRRWRTGAGEPCAPRARAALWLIAPAAAVLAVWLFNRHFGLENDLLSGNSKGRPFWVLFLWQFPERSVAVAAYFVDRVLLVTAHSRGILLALVLVVLARPRAALASSMLAPLAAVVLAIAGYYVVFVGSPHHLEWHLSTAAGRVLFQVVPVAALVLGVLLDDTWTAWRQRVIDTDD